MSVLHVVHVLSAAALVAAALGCIVFVVLYQVMTGGRWRRGPYGRNVMAFMGVCAALLAVAIARQFLDILDDYLDWLRLASFTLVSVIVWHRVALLIRAQREGDHDRDDADG